MLEQVRVGVYEGKENTKTVKPCHPAAAQLRVYFKFRPIFRAADNPTVTVTDCVELMYA